MFESASLTPGPVSARLLSAVALLLLLVSTLHTKVAGALLVLLLIISLVASLRLGLDRNHHDSAQRAATLWLRYVVVAALLWWASAIAWGDPWARKSADLHSAARLVLSAAAIWALMQLRGGLTYWPSPRVMLSTVAAASVAAFALSLVINREAYPSNAIAWAGGIAFLVCILASAGLDRETPAFFRSLYLAGSGFGTLAILNNQSRGAYVVLLWLILLIGLQARRRAHTTVPSVVIAALLVVAAGGSALVESDPLRIRQGWAEARAGFAHENFNTPVGARIYLYRLAVEKIADSPLLGVGPDERLTMIKSIASESPEKAQTMSEVISLGHVHNAYLHHLLDGGLVALTGFLLIIVGLVHVGAVLQRAYPLAAWQCWGIAFIHSTTNLSNVNFAHNYYAVMLSLSIFMVFVVVRKAEPRLA